MRDLAVLFDESRPFPEGAPGCWEDVLAGANRRRALRLGPVAALAVAVVAAAMLALFWPFGGGRPGGILDRALAAAGDGPVVHLVVREGWGSGTLVDLETGARSSVYTERELWYDPSRGLHDVARLGGQKVVDVLSRSADPISVREFESLARNYRNSLESGSAEVVGAGTLDGTPVYWVRFETRHFPSDGKMRELGDDIAISQSDFLPVATRETVDGKLSPDGLSRILDYETLPAGSGDFTNPQPSQVDTRAAYRFGSVGSLTPAQAAQVLPALWAGNRLGGLPLAGVTKLEWAKRQGSAAWTDETFGVRLAYGSGEAALPSLPGRPVEKSDGPYVVIDESPANVSMQLSPARIIGAYEPPAGQLFLQGEHGTLIRSGVALAINATSPDLVVQAAEALQPIPSG